MDYNKARFRLALAALLKATVVVIFQEQGQWCVIGQDIYQGANGTTRQQALSSWKLCFISTVLLHAMTDAVWPMRCPDDVWADLINRQGATVARFGFSKKVERKVKAKQ